MDDVYILNPIAGRGRGRGLADELRGRLSARGMSGTVRETTGPADAVRLAREAAEAGATLVVAVGGDGTAHEVVNGIAGTSARFGLVPLGTGNDLALALGIPAGIDAALQVIANGRDANIDLGRFEDGWFVNSVGLGFEAQVTIESRRIRFLKGFAVYLWAVVRALSGLRCPDFEIRIDGKPHSGRRLLVSVGNGPRVGGGFYLTPDAVNTDGWLDICLADEMGRCAVMRVLPKALNGSLREDPHIELLQGRVLEFRSREGFPFHADGEVKDTCRHELRIEILPGALPVRVPAATSKETHDG